MESSQKTTIFIIIGYIFLILLISAGVVTECASVENMISETATKEAHVTHHSSNSINKTETTRHGEISTACTNSVEKSTQKTPSTTKATTENSKGTKGYTENDLYYLAVAICREAGGESEEIQLLVANVVINRVNSTLYPNTVYGVLTQYKQYGVMWKNGVAFPAWADSSLKKQCYSIARRILEGERVCPENVLFQAEFEQGSGVFKQFGNRYYFCYY